MSDLEANDKFYRMNLHEAAACGLKDVVNVLLDNGCNVMAQDYECKTPLNLAIENCQQDIVELFIERGIGINGSNEVEVLFKKGADINDTDKHEDGYGQTLIHLAAESGHAQIVKLLLQWGADCNAQNGCGGRPLLDAAYWGHEAVVEILLAHGADINDQSDEEESTALLGAASRGHKETVEILLANGAEVNVLDNWTQSPLERAIKNGHKDIVELLRQHGAIDNLEDEV